MPYPSQRHPLLEVNGQLDHLRLVWIVPLHLQVEVHTTACFGPLCSSCQTKDVTFLFFCKSMKLEINRSGMCNICRGRDTQSLRVLIADENREQIEIWRAESWVHTRVHRCVYWEYMLQFSCSWGTYIQRYMEVRAVFYTTAGMQLATTTTL